MIRDIQHLSTLPALVTKGETMNRKACMKRKLILGFAGFFFGLAFVINCFAEETFHFRSSRSNPDRIFKFRNVQDTSQLIPLFPLDSILKDSYIIDSHSQPDFLTFLHVFSESDTIKLDLYFRVFSSISYAEEKLMENFLMDAQAYKIGEDGVIGDTSWWAYSDYSNVWFIRNNIIVNLKTNPWSIVLNDNMKQHLFDYVKTIDKILCDSPKVSAPSLIETPEIISAEIISENLVDNFVTVRINAIDQKGRTLYFSNLRKPWGIPYSTDGILRIWKSTDGHYPKSLIWIMNEDHIVTAYEQNFF
jgi:hypothetical protein